MAAQSGVQGTPLDDPSVEQALLNEPTAFAFFQAVRLLERLLPEREGVGGFGMPADEIVRFTVRPVISFPGCDKGC